MQHKLQVRILKELIAQLDSGRNIDSGEQYKMPTDVYVDQNLAEREWQTLFRSHPQLIGMSADLPEKNSYFTVEEFGIPVLATRDEQGNFRAFLNACRHRGVSVTRENKGVAKRFVCPFHAWTYASNGSLIGVSEEQDFGPIDKRCNGLIELPAAERYGMLWVHPQPQASFDVDELFGEALAKELASHNLQDYVFAGDKEIDKRLNWKLANDTFGETYHFQKLHRDTLGQVFYGNNLAYEEFGRHHRFVTASKSIDEVRARPESEWKLSHGAILIYYLFPNIQLLFNTGRVSVVRIYPVHGDPAHSITRLATYCEPSYADLVMSTDAQGREDLRVMTDIYDPNKPAGSIATLEATMEAFYSTVELEDYAMGEKQQRAAESGVSQEVIFGRNEPPLHHYHRCFREALDMPPLKAVDAGESVVASA
ncbi:MAG: aromatic ring-hydroxylating dioxygenase subunit alpha [Pseudomonadales bacterium]|nr:aromatic ring-hydroxylating dioxygenase subunit alpha [Pseudomonadales bacterium]